MRPTIASFLLWLLAAPTLAESLLCIGEQEMEFAVDETGTSEPVGGTNSLKFIVNENGVKIIETGEQMIEECQLPSDRPSWKCVSNGPTIDYVFQIIGRTFSFIMYSHHVDDEGQGVRVIMGRCTTIQ